jgi:hypothetical protein
VTEKPKRDRASFEEAKAAVRVVAETKLSLSKLHIGIGSRNTQRARPWVARGFAMRGRLTLVIGTGGSSKTQLTMQALFNFALGQTYAGWKPICKPDHRLKTMFVSGEEDNDEMNLRLEVICRHHIETVKKKKFTEQSLADLMLELDNYLWTYKPIDAGETGALPSNPLVYMDARGSIKRTPFCDQLFKDARDQRPDVICIDPLVSMHSGFTEGETIVVMQEVVRLCRELAVAGNCAVVLVHHASQAGSKDVTNMHAARGSTSLTDGGRVQLNLAAMEQEMGEELELAVDAYMDFVVLANTKSSYAKLSLLQYFERRSYELTTPLDDGEKDYGFVMVERLDLKNKKQQQAVEVLKQPWLDKLLDHIDKAHAAGDPYTRATTGSGKRADSLLESISNVPRKGCVDMLKRLLKAGVLGLEDHVAKNGTSHVQFAYKVLTRPAKAESDERANTHI